MSTDPINVVVIGASLAGLKVVEYLRRGGFEGGITLIGDEPHLPYDRPPLSKKVIVDYELTVDDIALRTRPWDDLNVNVVLGDGVREIDPDSPVVRTVAGREFTFDALFIATGVEARKIPGQPDAENVLVVRRWEDSVRLRDELRTAERVAIIGGGFIGSEVAAVCRGQNADVVMIEASETLMQRGLSSRWGHYMESVHRSHGVDIRTSRAVKEFVKSGERVTHVVLDNGESVEADVFVVGIGAYPATDWIEAGGITCNDGVLCDEFCESSRPGVYAVGDVARWHHVGYNRTIRVEHWTNADEMAKAAVANYLAPSKSERTPFAPVPMVWSDQYDLKIQVAGEIADVERHEEFAHYAESVHFGDVESGEFAVIQRDDEVVHGVLSINRASVLVRVKMLLERGANAEQVMGFIEKQEARFLSAQKAREEASANE